MAYAYIASRPVRFDKDYAIGEIIPESVIDPRMTSKLEGMGKITKIELPEEGGKQEAQNEEFKCEKCGKVFKTANALTAHSRTHKK